MLSSRLLPLIVLLCINAAQSQNTASQSWPAYFPLAVRSPYLSSWVIATQNSSDNWPIFYQPPQFQSTGWVGHIRVDNITYTWMGTTSNISNGPPILRQVESLSTVITPTRTIQHLQAGGMDITVTYLSPIEPSDWSKQSMPFSYMAVNASSSDGQAHEVQLYSDISAEWVSGDRDAIVNWTLSATNQPYLYHKIQLVNPEPFQENTGQASDGVAYYAMALEQGVKVTYQSCQDVICRAQFTDYGYLNDTQNIAFRAISPDFPVFAFAVDLGNIKATNSPVVWSVGYVRNPSINYEISQYTSEYRSLFFWSDYQTIDEAIYGFLTDYEDALSRAIAIDNRIQQAAASYSSEYSSVVSFAVRQVFGALDITLPQPSSDGTWDTSDVKIFMKNLGIDGRVNPVEGIYAALPMFLYINASYVEYLLAPLFEMQNPSTYPYYYAARDIGTAYPNASLTSASADSQEGVEQTGNMLIMTYAHALYTGNGNLISANYDLLKRWAEYLVNHTLYPSNPASMTTKSSSNSTNLAVKGIIALNAMSRMSAAMHQGNDYERYAQVSSNLIEQWQSAAMASDHSHLVADYGNSSESWALMYNLYPDRLLSTSLLNQSVCDRAKSTHDLTLIPCYDYGIPISSGAGLVGNSAWLSFTAATVENTTLRDQFLSMVWKHATSNVTGAIFPPVYYLNGTPISGSANPAQGAVFAPLALRLSRIALASTFPLSLPQSSSITVTSDPSTTTSKAKSSLGAIIGGVVGGAAAVLIIASAAVIYRQRYGKRRQRGLGLIADASDMPSLEPIPYIAANNESYSSNPTASSSAPTSQEHISSHKGSQATYMRNLDNQSGPSYTGSIAPPSGTRGPTEPDPIYPPAYIGEDPREQELNGLRVEMQELRRAMEAMYVDQMEAPPSYS
ncbi:hypothetical protein WOLCODRAFT_103601 [Wolfiporia cocos MD-104 SS10]|uniref:DUF1793-domain-containing protein n=1 Tax=Wolfiporia cocos (strain MD-104) TaxID=742152 RepID=A0A2H3K369_WOLCO|nr:hypothetical protein WOLCODRAFT_103601 [Wolfiporia cocos MD-104 SS10]